MLTIHSVSKYMRKVGCEAKNIKNRDYKESLLNVQTAPVIDSIKQHTNTTNVGLSEGSSRICCLYLVLKQIKSILFSLEFQVLTVTCRVQARPAPIVRFGRNDGKDLKISIHNDDLERSGAERSVDLYMRQPDDLTYEAVLKIRKFAQSDAASYYCTADNDIGNASRNFSVSFTKLKDLPRHEDLRACCKAERVQNQCLDICTFRLDFDLLSLEGNTCNDDFGAFMKCGSDGSDHRHCCQQAGVSEGCLDFCRGRVPSAEAMAADGTDVSYCLNFMREIGQCFQEGQYTLPGPPQNLRVTPLDSNSAMAVWDPPVKNPQNVKLYRIIWRQPGRS